MAPSAILKETDTTSGGDVSSSRYLSSTSALPPSAPSPSLSLSKDQQKALIETTVDGTLDKDTPMADSPIDSEEEKYWSDHPRSVDDRAEDHDDSSHEHSRKQGDSGEVVEAEKQQRRPIVKKNANYQNDNYNSSSTKPIPSIKYAKAGILSPPSGIVDRGGNGGANYGDIGGQIPGEASYLSQNPGNRASGQYQMQPGYASYGNGANGNGNYNNGNGNNGVGGYGPNGPSSPQPYPYNGNGAQPPPYPFYHFPQQPPGLPYYFDPNGQFVGASNTTAGNGLNVRGEEVGIVLVVLLLWVGAIILFFNRWGKIRMLEPYQPKFCENHRPSCPMAEVTAISNIPVCRERGFSKYNLSTEMLAGPNGSPHFVKCNYHGIPSADPTPGFSGFSGNSGLPGGLTIPGTGFMGGGSTGMLNNHRNSIMAMSHHQHHLRPRQNSVFVTSPSSQVNFYGSDSALKSSSRKTKSAVDLPTLVLSGEFIDNVRRNSKNSVTQL